MRRFDNQLQGVPGSSRAKYMKHCAFRRFVVVWFGVLCVSCAGDLVSSVRLKNHEAHLGSATEDASSVRRDEYPVESANVRPLEGICFLPANPELLQRNSPHNLALRVPLLPPAMYDPVDATTSTPAGHDTRRRLSAKEDEAVAELWRTATRSSPRSKEWLDAWMRLTSNPCFCDEANWQLASHEAESGQTDTALERFARVSAASSRWPIVQLRRAEILLAAKRLPDVERILEALVPNRLVRSNRVRFWEVVNSLAEQQGERALAGYANRSARALSPRAQNTGSTAATNTSAFGWGIGDEIEQELGKLSSLHSSIDHVVRNAKRWARGNKGLELYIRGAAKAKMRGEEREAAVTLLREAREEPVGVKIVVA